MTPFDPPDLIGATNRLARKVDDLGKKISLSEENQKDIADQADRLRNWLKVLFGLGALVLAALVVVAVFVHKANTAADNAERAIIENKANAVTNCKNANQSREGSLRLWLGVLDAPRPQGAPTRTPEQLKQVEDLRAFVEALYQKRDCNDLSRKYPLPELPDSLKPRSE